MNPFKKILVVLNGLDESQPTLETPIQLVERSGSELTVVDIVPEFNWTQRMFLTEYEHLSTLLKREKKQQLKRLIAPLTARGIAIPTKVLEGRTSLAIIREAAQGKYDVIVKRAKGPHSRRPGSFGTTAHELLRNSPCAVWLLSSDTPAQCKRIVAAVDAMPDDEEHSKLNERIMTAASQLCEISGARLDIIHSWSMYGERLVKEYMKPGDFERLDESLRDQAWKTLVELAARHGIQPPGDRVHLLRGEASEIIPQFVRENHTDLLVMGTVSRQGVAGYLIGNTAEIILGKISCSVLAVKPEGFMSPVNDPKRAAKEPPVPATPDVT